MFMMSREEEKRRDKIKLDFCYRKKNNYYTWNESCTIIDLLIFIYLKKKVKALPMPPVSSFRSLYTIYIFKQKINRKVYVYALFLHYSILEGLERGICVYIYMIIMNIFSEMGEYFKCYRLFAFYVLLSHVDLLKTNNKN